MLKRLIDTMKCDAGSMFDLEHILGDFKVGGINFEWDLK
jgi:hypothetical protein